MDTNITVALITGVCAIVAAWVTRRASDNFTPNIEGSKGITKKSKKTIYFFSAFLIVISIVLVRNHFFEDKLFTIKSAWHPSDYLIINQSNQVEFNTTTIIEDSKKAKWMIEYFDGTNVFKIRNFGTKKYLNVMQDSILSCTDISTADSTAGWVLEKATAWFPPNSYLIKSSYYNDKYINIEDDRNPKVIKVTRELSGWLSSKWIVTLTE